MKTENEEPQTAETEDEKRRERLEKVMGEVPTNPSRADVVEYLGGELTRQYEEGEANMVNDMVNLAAAIRLIEGASDAAAEPGSRSYTVTLPPLWAAELERVAVILEKSPEFIIEDNMSWIEHKFTSVAEILGEAEALEYNTEEQKARVVARAQAMYDADAKA